jgi:hypothetical protein
METKFIEGTNEQYSIRKDGVVIQHYKFTWTGNITYKESFLKKHVKNHCVFLRKNKKNIGLSINTLLLKYFNYKLCIRCSSKIHNEKEIYCIPCKKEATKIFNAKSRHKYLYKKPIYDKKMRENITRAYASSMLKIPTHDIPDDIYNLFKANLKIKRLLSEKTGIPTNLIK